MPILLLDDVFSELDDKRQNEIMKLINKGIQTFITTTSIGEIDKNIIANAKIFNLNKDKGVEHER
jgi:DNA replication and repair protein RecF